VSSFLFWNDKENCVLALAKRAECKLKLFRNASGKGTTLVVPSECFSKFVVFAL